MGVLEINVLKCNHLFRLHILPPARWSKKAGSWQIITDLIFGAL